MSGLTALLVDDDAMFRDSLAMLVSGEGFTVREAGSLVEARERIQEAVPDLVLLDIGLPDGEGLELLRELAPARTSEIVVITGNASIHSAVQAIREGALDYLTKPVEPERLRAIAAGVVRTLGYKLELNRLNRELRDLGRFGRLIGRSPAIQTVYDLIARVAPTQATVMITGASGTGKELAAETIHLMSARRSQPFFAINCGAIAKTLIESELFGHERGSFTGADSRRRGYFEQAHRGTLFLDEVTEMPLEAQSKLLRVLENGTLMRVGGSDPVQVDVRVVAATNSDPNQAVADGRFREDLFYRLNVFPISMPTLGEREGDIELLADHFLELINAREGTKRILTPASRAELRQRAWPGNVRELKNVVERAAILSDHEIGAGLVRGGALPAAAIEGPADEIRIARTTSLAEAERQLILGALEHHGGDKPSTAESLGISLKTLYTRLQTYGLGRGGALPTTARSGGGGASTTPASESAAPAARADQPAADPATVEEHS
jgi:DNA-binding NtrC family response regulator